MSVERKSRIKFNDYSANSIDNTLIIIMKTSTTKITNMGIHVRFRGMIKIDIVSREIIIVILVGFVS